MLYNEDCLKTMSRLNDESIDFVITSPPYDALRTYNGYSFNFDAVARELHRILKPGGVIVWIVNDASVNGSRTGTSFKQALHFMSLGLNLHDVMIWQKPNYAPLFPSIKRYDQCHEYMMILSKGSPREWHPIKDKPKSAASVARLKYGITHIKADGTRSVAKIIDNGETLSKRNTVWLIPNGQKRGLKHPAVFPEALVRDHLLTWTTPEAIVYDPFMGSGTTAAVAESLGRQWIGSEISPEYCNLIEIRLGKSK